MSFFAQKPAVSAAPLFGGGSSTTGTSLFGGQQTTTPFGTNTTTASNATGTSLFGSTTKAAPSLFGGGTSMPTSSTSGGGLFGSGTTAPAVPSFFGSTGMAGSKPTTTSLFPSYNSAAQPLAASQPAQPQAYLPMNAELLARSLTGPELYGDERDSVIAKLNQLQAFCGCGKGYVRQGVNPVQFTVDGPFCRFRATGYNLRQSGEDSNGLVSFTCKLPVQSVSTAQQQQEFLDVLFKIMGSKPQLHAHIESVKPLPDNECELVIYATETNQQTGAKKRVLASEFYQFLMQTTQKQQLQQQLAVVNLVTRTHLDDSALHAYLSAPPTGFDQLLWQQSRRDNPDPDSLIPVPIRGFDQLRDRQKLQVQEGDLQQQYLKALSDRISVLDANAGNLESRRCAQLKSAQNALSHRLLKLLSVQSLQQRFGFALDGEEEKLQSRLEALNSHMNAPGQLKGRLNELLSLVRCQPDLIMNPIVKQVNTGSEGGRAESSVKSAQEREEFEFEVQRYLTRCQEGLERLVKVVERDTSDIKTIVSKIESGRIT